MLNVTLTKLIFKYFAEGGHAGGGGDGGGGGGHKTHFSNLLYSY